METSSPDAPDLVFKQYLQLGPDIANAEMVPETLESLQVRLCRSGLAEHQHAVGWLAIERSLALTSTVSCDENTVISLFESAEEGFTNALDYHDEDRDSAAQLWKIELDMAAMPLYYSWATGKTIETGVLETFIEDLREIGEKVLAICASKREDAQALKDLNGLAAEVIALLAYNRMPRDNPSAASSLALPSTLRQDRSTWSGTGPKFTSTRLRSNWDTTTITPAEQMWGDPREKLQVKGPSWTFGSGKGKPKYHPGITPISIRDHLSQDIPISNIMDVLKMFLHADEPNCPTIIRDITTYMTNGMYEQIANHRATLQPRPPES